ncbi:unnamed protein product [Trichobilharzia regenti]|nr:unnamed protein product [Trichobilharzia regenti]
MCHWGECQALNSLKRCRFCGTKFCTECGRGEFYGVMITFDNCQVCKAADYQEAVPEPKKRILPVVAVKKKKSKKHNRRR